MASSSGALDSKSCCLLIPEFLKKKTVHTRFLGPMWTYAQTPLYIMRQCSLCLMLICFVVVHFASGTRCGVSETDGEAHQIVDERRVCTYMKFMLGHIYTCVCVCISVHIIIMMTDINDIHDFLLTKWCTGIAYRSASSAAPTLDPTRSSGALACYYQQHGS